MKIGTVTFWWCHENYGQILQVFAFQRFLASRGHNPFLIRYIANKHFSGASPLEVILRLFRHPITFSESFLFRLTGRYRRKIERAKRITPLRDFDGFRRQHLSMTSRVYHSYQELINADDIDADIYTVGSDVVWKNFPLDEDGMPMFLVFGRNTAIRMAYSASFGSDVLSAQKKEFIKPLLSHLDYIGVREASGVDLCREMGRLDAEHVLDPLFLLDREDYAREFSFDDGDRKGVFGYYLASAVRFPLHEIMNLPNPEYHRIEIATVYDDMGIPPEFLVNPTIEEWVSRISSAKLVVTNSFHGTVMSIVLHTPFVVILKHSGKDMDSRLLSVLRQFGLTSRVFDNTTPLDDIVNTPIDWARVDSFLIEARAKALRFMEKARI